MIKKGIRFILASLIVALIALVAFEGYTFWKHRQPITDGYVVTTYYKDNLVEFNVAPNVYDDFIVDTYRDSYNNEYHFIWKVVHDTYRWTNDTDQFRLTVVHGVVVEVRLIKGDTLQDPLYFS